jgi:hypothetical protein
VRAADGPAAVAVQAAAGDVEEEAAAAAGDAAAVEEVKSIPLLKRVDATAAATDYHACMKPGIRATGLLAANLFATALACSAARGQESVAAAPAGENWVRFTSVKPPSTGTGVEAYGLTRDDLAAIQELAHIGLVAPMRFSLAPARFHDREADVRMVACTETLGEFFDLAISQGRFLTKSDVSQFENVTVLGAEAASSLFGRDSPLGQNLNINGNYFLIVGVAKGAPDSSSPLSGMDVYVPASAWRARQSDLVLISERGAFRAEQYELSEIWLAIEKRQHVSSTVDRATALLKSLHEQDDYRVSSAR